MGFDIECIIDIQTYPGEYFCPVCRTLVYPNEAFQSQCRHLYCKPCLEYITKGSQACPYDEFLVTESDSKPLMDSDKALAENIGKVKVRCLYFRSGCTWEGPLSNCSAHCLGCTFGNSPVICNRCGIQIVHRQVHDHAQSCLGAHEGPQATGGVSGITKPGAISSSAEVNQAAVQSGAPLSQAPNPQNATAATPLPGQNPNVQSSAASQAPAAASVAVPTPEQWYQQQYQQYYQQYGGYDPYQQANQQYYSLQQQPVQQYQQLPVQVNDQYQSHVYSQPLQQSYPIPQAPQQSHIPQAQGQAQTLPQAQPNVVPPQGQTQLHVPPNHASFPNYQFNQQQQTHPTVRPQTQIPPQALPPPQTQPSNPQQPYVQTVGSQPPAQHPQYQQQYQQHLVQVHHPQPPQAQMQQPQMQQPQMQQPQMQSQSQAPVQTQLPQSSSQLHGQIQPQQPPYLTQSQPPVFPQASQSAPAAMPQAPHQPVPPVSGHQSYINPQPPQRMHSGGPQQHPMHPQTASGSQHPVQLHGQIPQQHAHMRPPPQGPVPHQHPPTLLPPQNQQFPPHPPQLAYPQHRPVMQPALQPVPQNYAPQPHLFPPPQSLLHHPGHLIQQPPMQMQMRSSGPPSQQSQNFVGRPLMPNQGIQSQDNPLPSSQFGGPTHPGPAQLTSVQTSVNQNYAKATVLEPNATVQQTRSPPRVVVEKVGEPLNEEKVLVGQNGAVVKDTDSDAGVNKSIKQDENHIDVQGAVEHASDTKSFEVGSGNIIFQKEGKGSDSLNQIELENQKLMVSNAAVTGPSPTNMDEQSLTVLPASGAEGQLLPLHGHDSSQQRPQAQVQGHPPPQLGPQGPGILPHPGKPLNSTEERLSGNVGPLNSFECQPGPQGSTVTDTHGAIGRAPIHIEGQYVGRSSEVPMSNAQLSGAGERALFSQTHGNESSSFRMNGFATADSISGSRDEPKALSREPLNPFPREPMRNVDPAGRSFDKAASHGLRYDAAPNFGPTAIGPHPGNYPDHPSGVHGRVNVFGPGHEFDHRMKHFSHGSPHRNYHGSSPHGFGGRSSFPRGTSGFDDIKFREAHRFGEGSQSFNHPSDPGGIPFHDGRIPPMSGPMRRGDLDGPRNPRFDEHMVPGQLHNQIGNDDVFGPDGPGHQMRDKFSGSGFMPGHFHMNESGGPGTFSGGGHAGKFGGPGNFPRLPFSEFVRVGSPNFSRPGEPPMMNSYSLPGFHSGGSFTGGMDSFDHSRKRKPVTCGWCRICEIDCESVEGLDMHSQTREHQNMAMDMVQRIKLQNRRYHRNSASRKMNEGGNRNRKMSVVGRGSKP